MVSPCICIVYICYAFQRISDIFFHHHTDLVYTRFIPWAVFPIYFHCIRSLHFLKDVSDFILDSSQLYVLVYICYIYSCSFPLYLHCICLLQFFVRYAVFFFFFFLTNRSCLHPLQILTRFPYVFALYTFVTLFFWKGVLDFHSKI